MTHNITRFSGEFRWLSNFVGSVTYDGVAWPTVEHAYQAAKTTDALTRARILSCVSPAHAKRLGRLVHRDSKFESFKLGIMSTLVWLKFAQNGALADKLIATGDCWITEGNTWGDQFWGVCNGVGENHLGTILMQVRDGLQ